MKNFLPKGLLLLISICMFNMTSFAQTSDQTTNDIIAIVKAGWAARIASPTNIAEQMKNISDDYTEFNNDYATRLDGKAINQRMGEANSQAGGAVLASEMLNPKVQVYGDCAIITYNYAGVNKDAKGEVKPQRAKSTRVYVKQGGKWMMVHANFAYDPIPGN